MHIKRGEETPEIYFIVNQSRKIIKVFYNPINAKLYIEEQQRFTKDK